MTDKCRDLFKYVTDIKYLAKNSSSPTIVLFGKMRRELKTREVESTLSRGDPAKSGPTLSRGDPVVLKISFQSSDSVLNNSLTVEEQIYRNIVSNLLNNNHTPHLVRYITTVHDCKIDWKELSERDITGDPLRRFVEWRLDDIKKERYFVDIGTVTILEKTSGVTFYDFLSSKESTLKDKLVAIFQILYLITRQTQSGDRVIELNNCYSSRKSHFVFTTHTIHYIFENI